MSLLPDDRRTMDGNERHNFVANVGDGALFSLGLSFVSFQTIVPVFVRNLGGSNVAIGLVPVLWALGFNLPQILIARFGAPTEGKKSLLLKTAIGQRIPWLLLALFAFFIVERVPADAGLLLFLVGFFLAAVGGSLNLPVWFDLIADLTPVRVRGRLFGMRLIVGAGFGMIGGLSATYVLGAFDYPANFGTLFLLAFGAMMCSYLFLMSLRERPGRPRDRFPVRQIRIPDLRALLRARPRFRRFVIADALLITGTMAHGFFAVHALEKFGLPVAYAGLFTIIMNASNIGASLLFGYMADRFGHKINLVASGAAVAAGSVLALSASSVGVYAVAFVCLACSISLLGISRLPFLAELCTGAERRSLIALTNVLTSPCILFGVVAGWLANQTGFETVFAIAGLCSLAAVVWLIARVDEPRVIPTHQEDQPS